MIDIFELAKSSIKNGGFQLNDKLRELTAIMIVGQIAADEYEELARLAQEYANQETDPTNTNILGALKTINTELVNIKARLDKLEEANNETPVKDEYPEWERWDGLPDSGYKFGDKVKHLGVKYVSNYIGINVWEPGLQGTESLWSVIE